MSKTSYFFLVMTIITFFLIFNKIRIQSNLIGCKDNLMNIGKGMNLYKKDYGQLFFYPDENGSKFLTKLYEIKILEDPNIYICPNTLDSNNNGSLLENLELGDPNNVCSYAGRKNKKESPFHLRIINCPGVNVTPIASDDINQPNGENHTPVFFIDFDGFVFEKSNIEIIDKLRDPLTN